MQYTENYSLRKPQAAETASYQDLNYNSDKIDGIMADNRQISLSMYVSGNTYNTGDLVGYENPSTHHIRVYRCLVDNVTGVWDSTKWTLTNLADEIIDAKQSGGTEVVANPTGTAVDTLNTVKIDDVIYEVGGDSANQNIADAFSELQTYAVGDYCIYESILYKCTTAVSTAGTWDSTKWTSCVVTDEMGSGGGGSDLIVNAQIYSTEEREVGVWIDGKPFYQKTITLTNITVPSNGSAGVQTSDYFHNVDCIISYECTIGSQTIPSIHVSTSLNPYSLSMLIERDGNIVFTRASGSSVTISPVVTMLYTKTTDIPGSGGYSAYGLAPVIYSTEEREIGVWTDGKPLYQKTVLIDNISSTTGIQRFAHGISNIETVIATNGTWINKSDSTTYIGTKDIVRPDSPIDNIGAWADVTNIVISAGVDRSNQKLYITIQYTKTTDTPGSGTWTPQGVPAVHYSTNEHIVGTWIDGKPIYEKTINVGSLSTGDNNVAHGITDLDFVVSTTGKAKRGNSPITIPQVSIWSMNWNATIYDFSSSSFNVGVGSSYTGGYALTDCYITIQYTKSSS